MSLARPGVVEDVVHIDPPALECGHELGSALQMIVDTAETQAVGQAASAADDLARCDC